MKPKCYAIWFEEGVQYQSIFYTIEVADVERHLRDCGYDVFWILVPKE